MRNFVLCYDLNDQNSRGRLAKICERFGIRVQYSVFEFHLNRAEFIKFEGELQKNGFLSGEHSIIFYPLHTDDGSKIRRYGQIRHWDAPFEIL